MSASPRDAAGSAPESPADAAEGRAGAPSAEPAVDSAQLEIALDHLRDGRARAGRLHRDIDEPALVRELVRRCALTEAAAQPVAAAAMALFAAEVAERLALIERWSQIGLSERAIARRLRDEHALAMVTAQREVSEAREARYQRAADERQVWADKLAASRSGLEQVLAEPGLDAAMRVRAIGALERVIDRQMAHAALPSLARTGRVQWARGMGRLGGLAGVVVAVVLSAGMSQSIGDLIIGLMGLVVPLAFVGFAAGRALGWACEGFRDQR